MDPDEVLSDLLEYARMITGEVPGAAEEWGDTLAEAFLALDEWISRGGALPARWTPSRYEVQRPAAR
ncbi:hypothetical protein [Yinghuangia seranimata]|uniref:hypothetical protein n=1 Tax=Yinghuangia seranimata TaxID=408067 RepID=UPI00248C5DB8|nr:hypothetical protein [Yinghuangia seranimata]MDI2127128.1 hypothetical protein [Yinghuangia seranimata]